MAMLATTKTLKQIKNQAWIVQPKTKRHSGNLGTGNGNTED